MVVVDGLPMSFIPQKTSLFPVLEGFSALASGQSAGQHRAMVLTRTSSRIKPQPSAASSLYGMSTIFDVVVVFRSKLRWTNLSTQLPRLARIGDLLQLTPIKGLIPIILFLSLCDFPILLCLLVIPRHEKNVRSRFRCIEHPDQTPQYFSLKLSLR